jgi:hypothetical protein
MMGEIGDSTIGLRGGVHVWAVECYVSRFLPVCRRSYDVVGVFDLSSPAR